MNFKKFILKQNLFEVKNLKDIIKNRYTLVFELKKIKPLVYKDDQRDFSRVIELVKPQNNLENITEEAITESNSFKNVMDLFGKTMQGILDLPAMSKENEKLLKTDYQNMAEALSTLVTLRIKIDPKKVKITKNIFNESSVDFKVYVQGDSGFAIDDPGYYITPCSSILKKAWNTGAGALGGAALGALIAGPLGAALGGATGYFSNTLKGQFGVNGGQGFEECSPEKLKFLRVYYALYDLQPGVDIIPYDEAVKMVKDEFNVGPTFFAKHGVQHWNNMYMRQADKELEKEEKHRQSLQNPSTLMYLKNLIQQTGMGAFAGGVFIPWVVVISSSVWGLTFGDFSWAHSSSYFQSVGMWALPIMTILGFVTGLHDWISKEPLTEDKIQTKAHRKLLQLRKKLYNDFMKSYKKRK